MSKSASGRIGFGVRPGALVFGLVSVIVTSAIGICVGPAGLSPVDVLGSLLTHVPFLHVHSHLSKIDAAIVWQIRAPRVVLGLMVGGMLALCGGTYQGVFRNPLADPYLLGSAAGAGLGATLVIGFGSSDIQSLIPVAAFVGALGAVMLTYVLGNEGGERTSASLILAGVAIASLLTALQTFIQQRQTATVRQVYAWILGRLSGATWADVRLIAPYFCLSAIVILVSARTLDVFGVGEDEASSLGIHVAQQRLILVIAASIGTAAAVSVSGLIGFVGLVVPHIVRLLFGSAYRSVLPLSLLLGGAFVVLADVLARTVLSPAEIPIGVVTACVGAPIFVVILRMRR